METNEKKFNLWLKNEVESRTYKYYIKDLEDLSKILSNEKLIESNIYEILDVNKIKNILNRLKKDGDLYEFNRENNHGGPSAALNKYLIFLEKGTVSENNNEFENLYLEIQEISKNITDPEILRSYNFFKLLWDSFVKEGIYFKTKKKDKEKNEEYHKLYSLFKGNGNYYATTIFNPIEVGNSMGGEHLELSINNQDKFYFHIPINLFENKKVKDEILKYILENNFTQYGSNYTKYFDSISDLKKEYLKFDSYLNENDIKIPKITYEEFIKNLSSRINQIKSNLKNKYKNNDDKVEIKVNIPTTNNNILETKKQIILYGPPGTGKTYNIKNMIYNFLENNELLIYNEKKLVDNKYLDLEKEGRVKFITFHQSYAYEEFIEGIKPNLDGNKEISYNIEDGSFKEFANNARLNFEKSKNNTEEIDLNKLIEYSFRKLENEEAIIIPTKKTEIQIYDYNNKTIFFEKKNKDRTHSLSLSTLSKIFYDKEQITSKFIKGGLEPYYNALIIYLNNKLKEIKKETFIIEKDEVKPYFLIIDEINRGNISKIFGELITLLEADKRLGENNELILELPYSKENFSVAPNLYIIATMNTSDKSIANLDIALRRRFGFIEMMPKVELISIENPTQIKELNEYYLNNSEIKLNDLLTKLNKRIEYLMDKDHTIGHSYFMRVNSLEKLQQTFYNEIIPLLEEYFYGNYEKLNLVLGSKFISEKFFDSDLFENNSEFDEQNQIYEIKDYRLENNIEGFKEAILNILNNNSNDNKK